MLKECLDVNQDGKINDADLNQVLKYLFKEKWRGHDAPVSYFQRKIETLANFPDDI